MKFFSVLAVAVLFASAVSAAPPTSPNFSFEEFGLGDVIENIGNKLKDYWVNVQCVRDVINKVIGESEAKKEWEQARAKIDALIHTEYQKCLELPSKVEQFKCKAHVVEQVAEVVTAFVKQLVSQNQWELVQKIKEKVKAECFEQHAAFFELDETEPLAASLPEQFECLSQVLGEVSKRNGLEELWSKTEPALNARISAWKQCPSAGNKLLVILCNLKEGFGTYKLVTEYIRLVAAENPQVVQEIAREIQQKCTGQVFAEGIVESELEVFNGVEKLKCIKDAISAGVSETDFEKIWKEYQAELEKLFARVKNCNNLPNKWEAAKCVGKELQGGRQIVQKFLTQLKDAHVETYQRVKKYIKERCFA